MDDSDLKHLRVLIANERRDRLELLAQVVIGLGHDVIAREIYVKEVGVATARERPDVALVGLGSSSEHALELFHRLVELTGAELGHLQRPLIAQLSDLVRLDERRRPLRRRNCLHKLTVRLAAAVRVPLVRRDDRRTSTDRVTIPPPWTSATVASPSSL